MYKAPISKFQESPPIAYMKIIADHCPRALSTYIKLWEERDAKSIAVVYKDSIKNNYMISITRFKNDLMGLLKEGLISIDETKKAYHIELVDWDECEAC